MSEHSLCLGPISTCQGGSLLWAKAKDAAAARVEPAGNVTPASFRVLSNQVLSDANDACLCGRVKVTNRLLEDLMGPVLSR